MECKTITTVKQFDELVQGGGLILVDFKADWCKPCKTISPIFKWFAKQNPNITFVIVDVDESAELSTREGIESMPTFVAYSNGTRIDSSIGANEDGIKNLIEKLKTTTNK